MKKIHIIPAMPTLYIFRVTINNQVHRIMDSTPPNRISLDLLNELSQRTSDRVNYI